MRFFSWVVERNMRLVDVARAIVERQDILDSPAAKK
jgi:hypothetical protein